MSNLCDNEVCKKCRKQLWTSYYLKKSICGQKTISNCHQKGEKTASVTAIEARLSAVQNLRASSGRLLVGSAAVGGAEPITLFFPTNQSKKKG